MEGDDSDRSTSKGGSDTDLSSASYKVEIPCQVRVWDKDDKLKNLSPGMEVSTKIRKKWIDGVKKAFNTDSNAVKTIRPWDLLLHLDGHVLVNENAATEVTVKSTETITDMIYPVRYQIPSSALENVSAMEYPIRVETFALGCLVYEITTLNKPYADLPDDEVQRLYNEGKFPEDPVSNDSSLLNAAGEYIRAHPYAFGFQVAGTALLAGSVVGLPILGALGFTAVGPAAGSAAAAWHASLGIVRAGSIFAWCQSAAMGGAAAGTLVGAGAAGAGVAGAATASTIPGVKEKVTETFKNVSDAVNNPGWQDKVKGAVNGAVNGAVKGATDAVKDATDAVKDPRWQENVKGAFKGAADAVKSPGWKEQAMGVFKDVIKLEKPGESSREEAEANKGKEAENGTRKEVEEDDVEKAEKGTMKEVEESGAKEVEVDVGRETEKDTRKEAHEGTVTEVEEGFEIVNDDEKPKL